jgi:hypothetical protein
MRTLTSLKQISNLPHSRAVRQCLLAELLLPFDSIESTDAFWEETSTTLYAVLPDEDVESLFESSDEVFEQFTCTEFITPLSDNWYLALAISSQAGGGSYLLFPCEKHSKLTSLLFTSPTNE